MPRKMLADRIVVARTTSKPFNDDAEPPTRCDIKNGTPQPAGTLGLRVFDGASLFSD